MIAALSTTSSETEGTKDLRGLFLNTPEANCSIYESGRMVYRALMLSAKYGLDYREIDADEREISTGYDFYIFNYHYVAMSWLDTKCLGELPGLKVAIVLEVLPNDPFALCPRDDFDAYLALDPTLSVTDKKVYAMPRPLEVSNVTTTHRQCVVPTIGTFGLATPGKGFELVVDAVNKEFDEAIVRINIPPGTHADAATWDRHKRGYAGYLSELCQKVAKNGIQVIVSHDYMTKERLIEWCSKNTLNCFLYNRNQPGLAATTDQAISSCRPLAVSSNETFRHIHPYIRPYPFQSLKESIASSQSGVLQMQKDWQPRNFALKFERVLENFGLFSGRQSPEIRKLEANLNSSMEPLALRVRDLSVSLPAPKRGLITELRAKLSLAYRLRKILKFELPSTPKRKQLGALAQELEEVRRAFYYLSGEVPDVQKDLANHSGDEDSVLMVSHEARQCGIHEYGINITQVLQKFSRYAFAYAECSSEAQLHAAILRTNPSAIIYNYYPKTMPWLTSKITRRYALPQLGIMHEVTQEDADSASREMFDYHLCPDPTLRETNPAVFKTRRLVPSYLNYRPVPDIVTIGSFGFGFGDKGFERLITVVEEEFDEARIRLHMPFNDIVDKKGRLYALTTAQRCRSLVGKPGITLDINHEFLSKRQLLDFLAGNTLNAFLYDTDKHRGISSTIEYALAVQRPIAITKCGMFRHVYSARPSICIEDSSLTQIIERDIVPLVPFYNDWSEPNFVLRYEEILDRVLGKPSLQEEGMYAASMHH